MARAFLSIPMLLSNPKDLKIGDVVQDRYTGETGIVYKVASGAHLGVGVAVVIWLVKRRELKTVLPRTLNLVERASRTTITQVNQAVKGWSEARAPRPTSPRPSTVSANVRAQSNVTPTKAQKKPPRPTGNSPKPFTATPTNPKSRKSVNVSAPETWPENPTWGPPFPGEKAAEPEYVPNTRRNRTGAFNQTRAEPIAPNNAAAARLRRRQALRNPKIVKINPISGSDESEHILHIVRREMLIGLTTDEPDDIAKYLRAPNPWQAAHDVNPDEPINPLWWLYKRKARLQNKLNEMRRQARLVRQIHSGTLAQWDVAQKTIEQAATEYSKQTTLAGIREITNINIFGSTTITSVKKQIANIIENTIGGDAGKAAARHFMKKVAGQADKAVIISIGVRILTGKRANPVSKTIARAEGVRQIMAINIFGSRPSTSVKKQVADIIENTIGGKAGKAAAASFMEKVANQSDKSIIMGIGVRILTGGMTDAIDSRIALAEGIRKITTASTSSWSIEIDVADIIERTIGGDAGKAAAERFMEEIAGKFSRPKITKTGIRILTEEMADMVDRIERTIGGDAGKAAAELFAERLASRISKHRVAKTGIRILAEEMANVIDSRTARAEGIRQITNINIFGSRTVTGIKKHVADIIENTIGGDAGKAAAKSFMKKVANQSNKSIIINVGIRILAGDIADAIDSRIALAEGIRKLIAINALSNKTDADVKNRVAYIIRNTIGGEAGEAAVESFMEKTANQSNKSTIISIGIEILTNRTGAKMLTDSVVDTVENQRAATLGKQLQEVTNYIERLKKGDLLLETTTEADVRSLGATLADSVLPKEFADILHNSGEGVYEFIPEAMGMSTDELLDALSNLEPITNYGSAAEHSAFRVKVEQLLQANNSGAAQEFRKILSAFDDQSAENVLYAARYALIGGTGKEGAHVTGFPSPKVMERVKGGRYSLDSLNAEAIVRKIELVNGPVQLPMAGNLVGSLAINPHNNNEVILTTARIEPLYLDFRSSPTRTGKRSTSVTQRVVSNYQHVLELLEDETSQADVIEQIRARINAERQLAGTALVPFVPAKQTAIPQIAETLYSNWLKTDRLQQLVAVPLDIRAQDRVDDYLQDMSLELLKRVRANGGAITNETELEQFIKINLAAAASVVRRKSSLHSTEVSLEDVSEAEISALDWAMEQRDMALIGDSELSDIPRELTPAQATKLSHKVQRRLDRYAERRFSTLYLRQLADETALADDLEAKLGDQPVEVAKRVIATLNDVIAGENETWKTDERARRTLFSLLGISSEQELPINIYYEYDTEAGRILRHTINTGTKEYRDKVKAVQALLSKIVKDKPIIDTDNVDASVFAKEIEDYISRYRRAVRLLLQDDTPMEDLFTITGVRNAVEVGEERMRYRIDTTSLARLQEAGIDISKLEFIGESGAKYRLGKDVADLAQKVGMQQGHLTVVDELGRSWALEATEVHIPLAVAQQFEEVTAEAVKDHFVPALPTVMPSDTIPNMAAVKYSGETYLVGLPADVDLQHQLSLLDENRVTIALDIETASSMTPHGGNVQKAGNLIYDELMNVAVVQSDGNDTRTLVESAFIKWKQLKDNAELASRAAAGVVKRRRTMTTVMLDAHKAISTAMAEAGDRGVTIVVANSRFDLGYLYTLARAEAQRLERAAEQAAEGAGKEKLVAKAKEMAGVANDFLTWSKQNEADVLMHRLFVRPDVVPNLESLSIEVGVKELGADRHHIALPDAQQVLKTYYAQREAVIQALENNVVQVTPDMIPNVGEYVLLPREAGGGRLGLSTDAKSRSDRIFRFMGFTTTPDETGLGITPVGILLSDYDDPTKTVIIQSSRSFDLGLTLTQMRRLTEAQAAETSQQIVDDLANRRIRRLLTGEIVSGSNFEYETFEYRYRAATSVVGNKNAPKLYIEEQIRQLSDALAALEQAEAEAIGMLGENESLPTTMVAAQNNQKRAIEQQIAKWKSLLPWAEREGSDIRIQRQFLAMKDFVEGDWAEIHKEFFERVDALPLDATAKSDIIRRRFNLLYGAGGLGKIPVLDQPIHVDATQISLRFSGIKNPRALNIATQQQTEYTLSRHIMEILDRTYTNDERFFSHIEEITGLKRGQIFQKGRELDPEKRALLMRFIANRELSSGNFDEFIPKLAQELEINVDDITTILGAAQQDEKLTALSVVIRDALKKNPRVLARVSGYTEGQDLLHSIWDAAERAEVKQKAKDTIDDKLINPLQEAKDPYTVALPGYLDKNGNIVKAHLQRPDVLDLYEREGAADILENLSESFTIIGRPGAQVSIAGMSAMDAVEQYGNDAVINMVKALTRYHLTEEKILDFGDVLQPGQEVDILAALRWSRTGSIKEAKEAIKSVSRGNLGDVADWLVPIAGAQGGMITEMVDGQEVQRWVGEGAKTLGEVLSDAGNLMEANRRLKQGMSMHPFISQILDQYYGIPEVITTVAPATTISPATVGVEAALSAAAASAGKGPSAARTALMAADNAVYARGPQLGQTIQNVLPENYNALANKIRDSFDGTVPVILGIGAVALYALATDRGIKRKKHPYDVEYNDEVEMERRGIITNETLRNNPEHIVISGKIKANVANDIDQETVANAIHTALGIHTNTELEKQSNIEDKREPITKRLAHKLAAGLFHA